MSPPFILYCTEDGLYDCFDFRLLFLYDIIMSYLQNFLHLW